MIWKSLGAIVVVLGLVIFVATQTPSTIHVEHTFSAPIDKVWTYWADAQLIKKYWGPTNYHAPVVEHDFRVGGKFLLGMQADSGGDIVYNAGTYREIVPLLRIIADMSFADAKGNALKGSDIPVPGKWPDNIVVTTIFEKIDSGKTKVSITEEGIPLIMKLFAQMGWSQQLEKLDRLLAQ